MSKYITLVFKYESESSSQFKEIRELAVRDDCRAWSMDHEIGRVGLIENAFDTGDFGKIKTYLESGDVAKFLDIKE